MKKFLERRELVSFATVTECFVSPEDFRGTLIVEKSGEEKWSRKETETLPDGTKHGRFCKANGDWLRIRKDLGMYKFGKLHGKLSVTKREGNEVNLSCSGNFVDGLAQGKFIFFSNFAGEGCTATVEYENGLPMRAKIRDYEFEFFWGDGTLKFPSSEFVLVPFDKNTKTQDDIFPIGSLHAWCCFALGKYGRELYGEDKRGNFYCIRIPVFSDKI
ncbi:hypothetical protein [Brazilian marseillevirus]|uniref:hypothetical protein n=1 Tax=Brazilian marseillevirus TaxID=1813599 RepID=UPI000781EF24|nr:hypothetical protein A3303_gp214 [Brazilian marseillevirus]AMQ10722.1 hypothetical protein [Brazilian marseillevirus]